MSPGRLDLDTPDCKISRDQTPYTAIQTLLPFDIKTKVEFVWLYTEFGHVIFYNQGCQDQVARGSLSYHHGNTFFSKENPWSFSFNVQHYALKWTYYITITKLSRSSLQRVHEYSINFQIFRNGLNSMSCGISNGIVLLYSCSNITKRGVIIS